VQVLVSREDMKTGKPSVFPDDMITTAQMFSSFLSLTHSHSLFLSTNTFQTKICDRVQVVGSISSPHSG